MPSLDERREVVAGLREGAEVSGCLIAAALKVMCSDFKNCIDCGEYCANSLADLIEERTCEGCKHHISEDSYYCKPCSRCARGAVDFYEPKED